MKLLLQLSVGFAVWMPLAHAQVVKPGAEGRCGFVATTEHAALLDAVITAFDRECRLMAQQKCASHRIGFDRNGKAIKCVWVKATNEKPI